MECLSRPGINREFSPSKLLTMIIRDELVEDLENFSDLLNLLTAFQDKRSRQKNAMQFSSRLEIYLLYDNKKKHPSEKKNHGTTTGLLDCSPELKSPHTRGKMIEKKFHGSRKSFSDREYTLYVWDLEFHPWYTHTSCHSPLQIQTQNDSFHHTIEGDPRGVQTF